MFTDVFGSITLVYEKCEEDVMTLPPRDVKKAKLVDFRLMRYSFLQIGLYESFVGFFMFFFAMSEYSNGTVSPSHLVFAWERWNLEGEYAGVKTMDERQEILYRGQTAFFVGLGTSIRLWLGKGCPRVPLQSHSYRDIGSLLQSWCNFGIS